MFCPWVFKQRTNYLHLIKLFPLPQERPTQAVRPMFQPLPEIWQAPPSLPSLLFPIALVITDTLDRVFIFSHVHLPELDTNSMGKGSKIFLFCSLLYLKFLQHHLSFSSCFKKEVKWIENSPRSEKFFWSVLAFVAVFIFLFGNVCGKSN